MKESVDISIKVISEQIRSKIIDYGFMWVIATQLLFSFTVGYYVGFDSRSVSPEHFSTLTLSSTFLFFSYITFFFSKNVRYRYILLSIGALFVSINAILLADIATFAFLSPDSGKKILLISFLIMLMSWNASKLILAMGTLPIIAFYTYLTSISPQIEPVDLFISTSKFPILMVVFYSTVRKFFEFVEEKIVEKMDKIHKLEKISKLDELTRIKNRKGFNSDLRKAIDTAKRTRTGLAVVILDIDFFKQYNDTKGHPAGDLCLKSVAAVLRSQCQRSIDSVCRIGGEEFALVMPATSAKQAENVVGNIRTALEKAYIIHPKSSISEQVTVSIGIAEFRKGDDFESLYQRADRAMYKAKVAGRDQYVVCFEDCGQCRTNNGVSTRTIKI